jgi:murein DD-endopeptidase MepM/ murein hydrolase activator NlpD
MAEVTPASVRGSLADRAAEAPAASTADRTRIQALAQEFESLMLLQVMRQVRETMTSLGGDDEEGQAVGGNLSALNETIDGELARYLSKAGGFGLSGFLQRALAHEHEGTAPAMAAPSVPPSVSASASAEPAAAFAPDSPPTAQIPGVSPMTAPAAPSTDATGPTLEPTLGRESPTMAALSYEGDVTSAFGWRTDPIVHTPRFHGGVDIRAAYGQEVPAAGAGTIVFSGEQGGYGTTVVVEHPSGLRTRYAHLSTASVRVGDPIAEGQTIGRAGQSGRATGPHVHLELTQGSQRLNPASVVRSAAFKKTGLGAD